MDNSSIKQTILDNTDITDEYAQLSGYQNAEHYKEVRCAMVDLIDRMMRGTGLIYKVQLLDIVAFFVGMVRNLSKELETNDPKLIKPILDAVSRGLGGDIALHPVGKLEDIAEIMAGEPEPVTTPPKKTVLH